MDDFFNPGETAAAPAAPAADPAASFLAGDLASVPDVTTEPVVEVSAPTDSPVDLSAEFAELDNQNVEVMNEDDLRKMTVQGDEAGAPIVENVDPSVMYSGISLADDRINQLKMESDAVREWREKNTRRIEDADTKETTDVADWKSTAKTQTEQFYKQYEAENEKRKQENRASSIASIIKSPESKEKAWAQIGDFIDYNAQRAANQTDKDRMKTLLFKLKQTPPITAK